MIHITESNVDETSVVIRVEGSLNSESLSVFKDVYAKHLASEKAIGVDLGSIMSVDLASKAFLREIRDVVRFVEIPVYLQVELGLRTHG